jgi:pimeloyl-ACP methyl ester carboxylesterase
VQLNHHRTGAGEPLVLIHGIGSRWQVWDPVLDRLAAEREVVALDLPGFGASPMPAPGTPAGVGSLSTLVSDFIGELGLDRPHVAGNSLGGLISLELAKRGVVRSVTALSPSGFFNRPEAVYSHASLTLSVRAARRLSPHAERLMASERRRRLVLARTFARPERIPAPEAVATLRAMAHAPWFDETLGVRRERFSGGEQIAVPVTVAWGAKDRLLLPWQARRAAAQIPRARIVRMAGCGHVPTYDDPELVAQVILEGSARVERSPAGQGGAAATGSARRSRAESTRPRGRL